jgi:2-keto-3-deoxy-L-rhamnonate aldolase RhmA
MIRIPEPRREVILKSMEMGAAEILLPQTEPVEQTKALVDCAMYAPFGNRGVSLLRVRISYEKISDAQGYMAQANANNVLPVRTESTLTRRRKRQFCVCRNRRPIKGDNDD